MHKDSEHQKLTEEEKQSPYIKYIYKLPPKKKKTELWLKTVRKTEIKETENGIKKSVLFANKQLEMVLNFHNLIFFC